MNLTREPCPSPRPGKFTVMVAVKGKLGKEGEGKECRDSEWMMHSDGFPLQSNPSSYRSVKMGPSLLRIYPSLYPLKLSFTNRAMNGIVTCVHPPHFQIRWLLLQEPMQEQSRNREDAWQYDERRRQRRLERPRPQQMLHMHVWIHTYLLACWLMLLTYSCIEKQEQDEPANLEPS